MISTSGALARSGRRPRAPRGRSRAPASRRSRDRGARAGSRASPASGSPRGASGSGAPSPPTPPPRAAAGTRAAAGRAAGSSPAGRPSPSKMPSKSACWNGSSLSSASRRSSSDEARIIACTSGSRSSAMNMCSVRQRPMPSAPNSRAFAASSGVSAFARTRRRRDASAQPSSVSKFSSICGGTSVTSPTMTSPVPPSIVSTSPSASSWSPSRIRRVDEVDRERLAAGHAGLAHPARDDRGVRRHAAVGREDAARLDDPVDVVRRRLRADEDDGLARASLLLRAVGVENDLAGRGARRGVQPLRGDVVLGRRVDHRVQQLVELRRDRCARPPPPR